MRWSRSQDVRIWRRGRSPIVRPRASIRMRFSTSTPSSRVPAPLSSRASSSSGCAVIPAPRPTSSTEERS